MQNFLKNSTKQVVQFYLVVTVCVISFGFLITPSISFAEDYSVFTRVNHIDGQYPIWGDKWLDQANNLIDTVDKSCKTKFYARYVNDRSVEVVMRSIEPDYENLMVKEKTFFSGSCNKSIGDVGVFIMKTQPMTLYQQYLVDKENYQIADKRKKEIEERVAEEKVERFKKNLMQLFVGRWQFGNNDNCVYNGEKDGIFYSINSQGKLEGNYYEYRNTSNEKYTTYRDRDKPKLVHVWTEVFNDFDHGYDRKQPSNYNYFISSNIAYRNHLTSEVRDVFIRRLLYMHEQSYKGKYTYEKLASIPRRSEIKSVEWSIDSASLGLNKSKTFIHRCDTDEMLARIADWKVTVANEERQNNILNNCLMQGSTPICNLSVNAVTYSCNNSVGFCFDNSVVKVEFVMRNNLKKLIKDPVFTCTHYGKSGTAIRSYTFRIYDLVSVGESKDFALTVPTVNQSDTIGCQLSSYK